MKFFSFVLVVMLAFASLDADAARRMGGGGSMGRQSSNVTQRDGGAAPAAPAVAPAQRNAQTPAAAPPAAARPSPWKGILGGLAVGLGLAWLANALGFGAGFANILMFILLAVVALAVVGMIMRRRAASQQGGLAYQGAGAAPADLASAPPQYNPAKVGNDASARPWERNTTAFDTSATAGTGSAIGSGLQGSQGWGVPAGFDSEGFLAASKRNFVTLQEAWDRGDIESLRAMMTDDMLYEVKKQLAEREQQGQAAGGRTEVEMLEAKLLGIEETVDDYLASVEFSGMIREDPSAGPQPFREVWNMVKTRDGRGGWLVAGVQALQ